MMKVMEWEVYVEKDLPRRNLKVWVESTGDEPDDRLNWFFKDGELVHEVRKIQNVVPEGFTPMFAGPMTMMREVIEKMSEAYPSRLFVRSDEHEKIICQYKDLIAFKDAEIKKWEERFDKALGAALRAPQPPVGEKAPGTEVELNFSPIMATLESTGDVLPVLEPNGPTAWVETFSFDWRDSLQMVFGAVLAFGIILGVGVAFGWW